MAYTTIDDPSAHFQTKTYTGNNTDGTQITNDGGSDLQPDWLWIKNRTDAGGAPATGGLWDSVRGFAENKVLTTFSTNAEGANSNGFAVATTDGFTVEDGTSGANPRTATNLNAKNYVAWQWKAGTSFTNDASSTGVGTIDSTGSANDTAGFSIVSYTGNGTSGATVKHGLSTALDVIFIKNRDEDEAWQTYHRPLGATHHLSLNATDSAQDNDSRFNDVHPTSSVFTLGNNDTVNKNTVKFIAYCFAEKKGYSKFGSYNSNNNANGTFIYTGIKPAFIILKNASTGGTNWHLYDNKRLGYNIDNNSLLPSSSNAESTADQIDILSNGFKIRYVGDNNNGSDNIIFMAFAESPFANSKGVPNNAR